MLCIDTDTLLILAGRAMDSVTGYITGDTVFDTWPPRPCPH